MDVYAIAIHNNFVKPSLEERKNEVENVKRWLEIGYKLGIKAIRVNSGRWKTIESFDELMRNRGLNHLLKDIPWMTHLTGLLNA